MTDRVIHSMPSSDLTDGNTVKFSWTEGEDRQEGFVVRHDGSVQAYRNRCRHIPTTLDWVENRFFSRDRRYLQCATHGALYDIDSGLCVWGPPVGESLLRLAVEDRGGRIIITLTPDPSQPPSR